MIDEEEGREADKQQGWFRTTQRGENETERERLAGEMTY